MITNLADFCLWMLVLVDDAWVQIAPALVRPGPRSRCTDSELIAKVYCAQFLALPHFWCSWTAWLHRAT